MIIVIAVTLVTYSLFYFLAKKVSFLSKIRPIVDSISLAVTAFAVIFSTGSLSSPFFFLTYFLLFILALIYGIKIASSVAIIFVVAFLFSPKLDILHEAIQLLSLIAIIPIVLYVSKLNEKKKKAETTIQVLKDEEEILEGELKEKDDEIRNLTSDKYENS